MVSVRADGITARDVVPQTVEPRGFLRRRKTDEPAPPPQPTPVVEAPAPALAAPVPAPVPVQVPVPAPAPVVTPPPLAEPVDVAPPLPSPPAEPAPVREPDELFRAQAALLQAALRQADELTAALAHEQQLRRQEIEHLTAENQLLRDALATLNAQALQRQQEAAPAPSVDLLLPEQRDHGSSVQQHEEQAPAVAPVEQPQDTQPLHLDADHRNGRRRSAREAGPA